MLNGRGLERVEERWGGGRKGAGWRKGLLARRLRISILSFPLPCSPVNLWFELQQNFFQPHALEDGPLSKVEGVGVVEASEATTTTTTTTTTSSFICMTIKLYSIAKA